MSSSFSMAKQGLKERMGRSHATLDEQFSASWANCQLMEDLIDRIRTHMMQYVEGIKGMIVGGHSVSDDFKSFYERAPSHRLSQVSHQYEVIQAGFRRDKLNLLERLVQQNVLSKLQEVKVELAGLRSKVGDREVARKRYDHYNQKIGELRDSRARAKAKGKELGVSDLDKLARNEKKFEDARLEFVAINKLVARSLWQTWARRFELLDPVFAEVVKIKANFTQALSNQLQGILQPLKQQMTLPMEKEQVPAVFLPSGGAQQQQQQQQQQQTYGDGGDGYDEHDVHGVMSPGGSSQMDPRQLAQRMQVATEKLDVDAAVAQRKAQEKAARAAAKQQQQQQQQQNGVGFLDGDDEASRQAAARRKLEAKVRKHGPGGAPFVTVVPIAASSVSGLNSARTPAGSSRKAQSPMPDTDEDEEEEEEEVDDDSDDDEEERARKQRKAAKKEKARQKERAAAAAAAAAAGTSKPKKSAATPSHHDSNSLDFLADIVGAPTPQSSHASQHAGRQGAQQMDLLAFSPMKPAGTSVAAGSMDLFGGGGGGAAAAPTRGKKLELDSFFGAAATAAPAAATPAAQGGMFSPGVAAAQASPMDPFADLPSAEAAEPVDLFAVPKQQQQQQQQPRLSQHVPQQTSDPVYNPNFPNGFPNQQQQQQQSYPPSYSRSVSVNPGGASLDDPFFSAPLPLPTAITPHAAAAATPAPAPAAAAAPVAKKKKKVVVPSSDEESSDSSDSSESEQEEGRAPKRAAGKAHKAGAKAAAKPNAAAGKSPVNTNDPDPFDFAANPTPSQLNPAAAPAPYQPPAAHAAAAAAAAKPRPAVNANAASFPSFSDPSPHGPPVPSMPRGGLPDLHNAPTPAAAAAAASQSHAAGVTPISTQSPGGPMSPEDYSPTREDFNPFPPGHKPATGNPLAGVDDPFADEDW